MTWDRENAHPRVEPPAADPNGRRGQGRVEFVVFRDRLKRLVDSLVELRDGPAEGDEGDEGAAERVEVELESDAVSVRFRVNELPWDTAAALMRAFQSAFVHGGPVFLNTVCDITALNPSREKDGSYGRVFRHEGTCLSFYRTLFHRQYLVTIEACSDEFNDHFEVFTTDAARTLLPAMPKRAARSGAVRDRAAWQKEFGRAFTRAGCRVASESTLGWEDLTGLRALRERLERSIFRPLAREPLYDKVASRVLPRHVDVLPRGVLLHGPPGCGKTWSMQVIAGEAGLPVVVLPCQAVLSKWYGESEQRLARVFELCRGAGRMILLIDEIDALARHRRDSHEASARMVSILLAEMDGLADTTGVLLVGSVNDVTAIDAAVLDRFDVKIAFAPPDADARRGALAYYARHLPASDVSDIAARLDGWNFRQIARFAEDVVRTYVSGLDVTQLEGPEPPLPRKEDYVDALARVPS